MSGASPSSAQPYDGRHLIADLHGCSGLDDAHAIERALRAGAHGAGATVLEVRLHAFGPGHGVTGMALLAESHISIHTWPEHGYAAVDIFVCGARNDAERGLVALAAALMPSRTEVTLIRRGYGAAAAG